MIQKIHFIAMGGSVMHQLALALHQKGDQVSGSDDEFYEPALSNLKQAGILPPQSGWHREQITPDLDAVILGMHARGDNAELVRAEELNVPIFSFPEYIYQESRDKTRVVIGGSHGKTTITAMVMHVLKQTGKDFDYLVGARLSGFDQSVRISDAPLIICEGDEYPASAIKKIPKFLFYHPQIAVLSGIAWDHINVFPTLADYQEQFARFIMEMEKGGCLIYNESDPVLVELVQEYNKGLKLQPYGVPTHTIKDGITKVGFGDLSVELQVFGIHNLQNLNAARLVCESLGIGTGDFLTAISSFSGASRRLEKIFDKPGATLFYDFAHAPSKVRASIHAVKKQFSDRKLIAVLELHTYSSLNATFLPQYHEVMKDADVSCVFYSNHALEIKRLAPITPDQIREGFGQKDLQVFNDVEAFKAFLTRQNKSNTNLLMMSSGNFGGLNHKEIITLWQDNQ